jgi:prepilin-type processing-associated H-X9-DG protein
MLRSCCVALALAALLSSPLGAQVSRTPALDTTYVPADMVAAVLAFPKRTFAAKELELYPLEMITAWGLQEVGFDPLEIEQALAVVGVPDPDPKFGIVLRFSKPINKDKVFARQLAGAKAATSGGKSYRKAANPQDPSLYIADDLTLVLADEATLIRMMAATAVDSPLIRLLKSADASGDGLAVLAVDMVRDRVMKEIAKETTELPPELKDLKRVPELVSTVEARVNIRPGLKNELVLKARDEKSAIELTKIADASLDYGRKQFLATIQASPGDPNDPVNLAMARYGKRLAEHYATALRPKREGDRLVLAADNPLGGAQVAVLSALVLPAVQAARAAAQRTQGMNSLKQVALAMLTYEAAQRRFPARAIVDKQGKPLLSWRVRILPYIEQQALYDKFKLDEPWDSPNNRELIKLMPSVYGQPNPEGKTNILVPVVKGTLFGEAEGVTIAKIKDGSSFTILAVEADDARAVVWTKPADLELNLDNPLLGLGALRPGGFNAAFADGHVDFLKSTINPAVLRALFTYDGGEEVQYP